MSSITFPAKFILSNGEKALKKLLDDSEVSPIKKKSIRKMLKNIPVITPIEQKKVVWPGNGVCVHVEDENEKRFYLIDGTEKVKEHIFIPQNEAVLSSSEIGRSLIGKKYGEHGSFVENGRIKSYKVIDIHLPSQSKWLFHQPENNIDLVPQQSNFALA